MLQTVEHEDKWDECMTLSFDSGQSDLKEAAVRWRATKLIQLGVIGKARITSKKIQELRMGWAENTRSDAHFNYVRE